MSSRPARGAARLAAILDALPDALLLVNGNGTVVNANAIAVETLEAPGAPLIGRGLLDIVPDFDPRRIPGSMRRPQDDPGARTKPTRMIARRTDGTELQVEVTSAGLNSHRSPYASAVEAAFADDYAGEELLMLVVRDLTGTLDTEAELVRQQRQTEMILRAASEGVVGVDTAGRIVLVNPAAAQILGHRASQLGGQELHPLIQHSRADGTPLAFEETPLHDTLSSGRKHRVRGQVLWTKDGKAVPVDLTTAPVRDGDQLVGAVLAFTDRRAHDALAARHAQLTSVLTDSLRGPLEELRQELSALAADPAGQLWPEANQVLHHLAAGYTRMTTLLDNVLSFQRLDEGREKLHRRQVSLESVVAAGVEGATELIGPGRAQFAVHAPPIEVEVDEERMALALAHLVADVAGVDATGRQGQPGGDSTIVVAAARRGDVVRIEVRGPHPGGSPVHEPIVRGVVQQHGGVVQTHEMPGSGGGQAYVVEVPVVSGTAAPAPKRAAKDGSGETTVMPVPAQPARGTGEHAAAEGGQDTTPAPGRPQLPAPAGTGRRRKQAAREEREAQADEAAPVRQGNGRRRRALASGDQPAVPRQAVAGPAPQPGGGPGAAAGQTDRPTGRRRRAKPPEATPERHERPELPAPGAAPAPENAPAVGPAALEPAVAQHAAPAPPASAHAPQPQPPQPVPQQTPPQPQQTPQEQQAQPQGNAAQAPPEQPRDPAAEEPEPRPVEHSVVAASPILDGSAPRPPTVHRPRSLPMPGSESAKSDPRSLPGVSVRTLGQGVPVNAAGSVPRQPAPAPAAPAPAPAPTPAPTPTPTRRRKLATPPADDPRMTATATPPQGTAAPPQQTPPQQAPPQQTPPQPKPAEGAREFTISAPAAGADEGPEPLDGPNGAVEVSEQHGPDAQPGGLRLPGPAEDELPPEPLDNPRRLLVWPEPDVSTQQALTDRGYRPVIVNSREEVDAQIAAYPAALFVDPLTGPITRTALQSLRQAAVAAEVPVLVTAGLGQASREAAYGADPAVLLKALAPRDSEQHPPRVLLVESQQAIANALAVSLERRGMQAAHASSDAEAVEVAQQVRPNLVVMDLNQVRRRRAGIIDWLRVNGLLARTPFVVYTAAEMDPSQLPLLASGETVLFLAERSTQPEVQARIVDLLAKIGAH